MKPEIQRVLNLRNYFRISKSYTNLMTYHLERPSVLLRNNIYINWLQSIHSKIHKNMPIFTCKKYLNDNQPLPFGFIINDFKNYDKTTLTIGQYNEEFAPKESEIELNVIVPQQDTIQYFTQWQRYRKYWWSSVSIIFLNSLVTCISFNESHRKILYCNYIHIFSDNHYTQFVFH